jgi:hypothetical protein
VSNAAFVLIAIGVIIVVSVLLWLLNRKPQTFMSSIDDFEREMKALGGEGNKGGPANRTRRRTISPSSRRPSNGPAGSNGAGGSDASHGAGGSDASHGAGGSNASGGSDGAHGSDGARGSGVGRSGADPGDASGESQP